MVTSSITKTVVSGSVEPNLELLNEQVAVWETSGILPSSIVPDLLRLEQVLLHKKYRCGGCNVKKGTVAELLVIEGLPFDQLTMFIRSKLQSRDIRFIDAFGVAAFNKQVPDRLAVRLRSLEILPWARPQRFSQEAGSFWDLLHLVAHYPTFVMDKLCEARDKDFSPHPTLAVTGTSIKSNWRPIVQLIDNSLYLHSSQLTPDLRLLTEPVL